MILIAHRGNTRGPSVNLENNPEFVKEAIDAGYDAEIDIWYSRYTWSWFLGHNKPTYKVSNDWLYTYKDKLWCHAKELVALRILVTMGMNCFWHDADKYTLTSKGFIWAYPDQETEPSRTIAVLPERRETKINEYVCRGICSDYIERYRQYGNVTVKNNNN